jgi:excisionase family DNA binding protein
MSTVYTVEEVAAHLKLRPITIYRAVSAGRLDALRIGRQIRIPQESLEAFTKTRAASAKD